MIEVNDKNFNEIVLESKKPVVIDFWAPWCIPCKMVSPVLEEISSELKEKVEVITCNVDESPQSAVKFGIKNIPTILYIKNGKIVDKTVGVYPKKILQEKINKII